MQIVPLIPTHLGFSTVFGREKHGLRVHQRTPPKYGCTSCRRCTRRQHYHKEFPHSEVVDDSKSFKDNSERQTQKYGLSPSNRQLRRWTSEELIMVRWNCLKVISMVRFSPDYWQTRLNEFHTTKTSLESFFGNFCHFCPDKQDILNMQLASFHRQNMLS